MKNYRPVSLLTVFCKTVEKAMRSRLSQNLHTHNILVTEQYGFRKTISTENAALKLNDSVLKSVNQEMRDGGLFCDLAKTFVCLNHEILLAELHFYGNQEVNADWLRSCLTNRRHKVEIKPSVAIQSCNVVLPVHHITSPHLWGTSCCPSSSLSV